MKLYDVWVEYQEQPIGLGVRAPRFSWKIASEKNNVLQTAWRVQVSDENRTAWDSGRVDSDASVLIPYAGEALKEETNYQVKITVEDNQGEEAFAETRFTTGLFDGSGLQAQMITHDFDAAETACPVFWQDFSTNKKIARAYLYATAHGVYEAEINGQRVGDCFMAPGWTEYHKRLQFQCYDVTDLIEKENRLEITVANGWYKGIMSYDVKPNRYGNRVAVLAEMHIFYEDGSKDIVATDPKWHVRTGEIRYSEIYMGETRNTFDPEIKEGRVSLEEGFSADMLVPQVNEPVRITERLSPVRIFIDSQGNQIADFGQNVTGLVELRVTGKPGQTVKLRHAETLDRDGVFYIENLRQAKAEDTFILNGKDQVLMPRFTFHGFRYAAVEGRALKEDMLTACVMHSDMRATGSFHCSNEQVNRLQNNIAWSLRDNFFDVPTDCPQRDERLGWMGDAQVFSWTAAFNRHTALFFTKWLRDVQADSSLENGVPHVVPDLVGSSSSAAWSDAAVIIPWVVYQTYGDRRILEENWKTMHEWVDYIRARCNEKGLWMTNYQYGDWLALDREISGTGMGGTDVFYVANACYLYITKIVESAALALGKSAEAREYHNLYKQTLTAFQNEYFTPRGRIVSETQTGCVLALHHKLSKEKDRETILRSLITNIENHKNHLTTGFVGTPYLCHALSENGAHEVAATLFLRDDSPSWLYEVKMGATTIWERWDAIHPDGTMPNPGLNSLNHYANGSIGDWMYRKLAGINQTEPGYRRFAIRPLLTLGLEEVSASFESPYGKIESSVICKKHTIQVKVAVPANTEADIFLPEKDVSVHVGSGTWTYEYPTETSLTPLRYTMDSTLGEILQEPLGQKMLNDLAPFLANNPMIEYAKRMTLAEGISSAPEIRPVYEAILKALNEQE